MPPIYLAPFFPHSQLKMWGNGAKQMGKHSMGRQGALAPWHNNILAKQT